MPKTLSELSEAEKRLICAELEKNAADECVAREGYFRLKAILPEEDQAEIDEIISDELDHSISLTKLTEKYSGLTHTSEYTGGYEEAD